jgi:predicted amidohydrolase
MKKKSVTVAGLQMLVTNNVIENEIKIRNAIKRAAREKDNFLLTPEGSLSGYHTRFDQKKVEEAVGRLAKTAKDSGVGLALGTCFKETIDGKKVCYNQVRLYTPEGEYLGFHGKILRTTALEHPGTGEMIDYAEGTLQVFKWKGIKFGILICNDMWGSPHVTTMPNTHLAWQLKCMGARFILHAINSGIDPMMRPYHESTVEIRARSLEIPIMEVNAAKPDNIPVNARSGPVLEDGSRPFIVHDMGEHYFSCKIRV